MEKSADKVLQHENATQLEERLDFDDNTLKAIAEVYKNEGNDEYRKNEFSNAIHFYTEGIKVKCKDEELNAKLYSNRATAHFRLGNYHESINDARAAVELQPTFIKAIARGVSACVELCMYEEAITWCDKGLAINKNSKTLLDLRHKSVRQRNKLQVTKQEIKERKPESQSLKGKQSDNRVKIAQLPNNLYEQPLQNAQETGDRCQGGSAYDYLGHVCYRREISKKAICYYEQYLTHAKEVEDRFREERVYINLGNAHFRLGNYNKAIKYYEQSLKFATRDSSTVKCVYGQLGCAYHELKNFKKAIYCHERCLKFAKEGGDRATEAQAQGNLGCAYHKLGVFKKAICYGEESLKIAKEVGNRSGEAIAQHLLGITYDDLGDCQKAVFYHKSGLKIAKEMGDRVQEGRAYYGIGNAYHSLGEFKKAIEYYERCITVAKETENRPLEGQACNKLGISYQHLGDLKKAVDYHEQQLKIAKVVEDRYEEGRAYDGLGNAYYSLGEFKKAIEYYERCITVAKETENRPLEGQACNRLGISYQHLGDLKKAIDYHEQQLTIAKVVEDRYEEGRAYDGLGNTYHILGDFQKAIDYRERSLEVSRDLKDRHLKGKVYGHLGISFFRLGDFKKAIEFHERRLKIAKKEEDRPGEGCAYGNLGNTYQALGNLEKAIDCFERRLIISKEIRDRLGEGHAYSHLGNAYYCLGDVTKAIEYFEGQLKIAKKIGEKASEGKAHCNLGKSYCKIGEVRKGLNYMELALETVKQVGDMVAVGDVHQNLGLIHESLDSLHEALQCFQGSVKAYDQVRICLQSKDDWQINLRDMHQVAYTALWRVLLKLDRSVEALCAAEKGRAQALKDLMEKYFGNLRAEMISSAEEETIEGIVSSIEINTIFLALDGGVINIWVIQNGKGVCRRVKEVGNLNTQNDVISSLQELLESTFVSIGVRAGENCEDRSLGKLRKPILTKESFYQTQSHSLQSLQHQLRRLYDVIMDSIADLIHGDEIIIVPEGPLWLVPYAALIDPNSRYLSDSFRIRVIPSLTSLKLILDCPADYHSKTGALLVGDPWVQEVVNNEGQKLQQLPCAGEEVRMISGILNTAPLTGKEATKNEVLKRLSSVALVHIAAHGRMETGEIALCPNPTRASQVPKDEDFLLTMNNVLNAKLTAKLVVLSCCHSGRGEVKAEGVVGIARAFLGAGARSVLVSLWAIDDEATMEFMKYFYQHLVKGRSASESLNRAMKCMRESGKFEEVKYWAPFELIGDDVTLEFSGSD